MEHATSSDLLSQLAKAYVVQNAGINPAAWPLTANQAWVSLAARMLRTRQRPAASKREVVTSK